MHTAREDEIDAAKPAGSASCKTLPTGDLDAYASRGWCRLEVIAALCPKRTLSGQWRPGPIGIRYRFHHDPSDPGIGPLLKTTGLFDPASGLFTNDSDRDAIGPLVTRIARRYMEYVASGSTVWAETYDMNERPEWLTKAGAPGAFASITREPGSEAKPAAKQTTPQQGLNSAKVTPSDGAFADLGALRDPADEV